MIVESWSAAGIPAEIEPVQSSEDLAGHDLKAYEGGVYGWWSTLPIAFDVSSVSLGEGNTPSVPLHTDPGSGPLWIKNEAAHPTWSHKGRAMSAALTKALELGATVVVASSGNAGAGATYSAPGVGGADAGVILGRYSR